MVNAKKLKGYWIDLESIKPTDGVYEGQVFTDWGVEKATVWVCSYCNSEEGYEDTKEKAENCCKKYESP